MTRVVQRKTEEGPIDELCLLEETQGKGDQPKIEDVWSGVGGSVPAKRPRGRSSGHGS